MSLGRGRWRDGLIALGLLSMVVLVAYRLAGPAVRAPHVAGLPERVDFNFHVRPILSDRCFKCHGPDDRVRKAGLRFDTREGAFAELESGRRAIVAGSPRRSELVRRILSTDPDVMMPEPGSHLVLSDRDKAILVRWIEQGADWQPHWAFVPPSKPAVPQIDDPRPTATEIDAFVLAGLRERGLEPAPEADRETLLRRVTFDLTGLPPTLDEIDAFARDSSPAAYEAVVDRLLSSSAYGERMASEWLDVARFADSHGYQDDGMRDMSPWRDWVIEAFNRNLPFGDFITWQLAGDLLDRPTQEQLLATGFNRHHMQSQEGGVVPEEYRVEYVVDRVNTLGRAFLGVTLECARCHDHKYDPVSQREFYQLYAFFNSVNETGQIPYSGMPSPTLVLEDDDARTKLAALESSIAALAARVAVDSDVYDAGFERWLERARGHASLRLPKPLVDLPLDASGTRQVPATKDRPARTEITFANRARPARPATLGGDRDRVPEAVPGRIGGARRLVGDSHIDAGNDVGMFERNEPFSFALWFKREPDTAGPLVTRSGGVFNGNRGYELILQPDGTFTAGLHHVFPDNSIEIRTVVPVIDQDWHHVTVTYDGSSRAAGLRVFIDGARAQATVVADHLKRSILFAGSDPQEWNGLPGVRIGRRHDETLDGVSVDEFRLFDVELTAVEVAMLAAPDGRVGTLLAAAADERSADRTAMLREHYVRRHAPGRAAPVRELTALRGRENELLTALPQVMIMRELPEPRPTFVLDRGAYDAPTDPVSPGTPTALLPMPDGVAPNRLGLARWLLDERNPLTARVLVNRYWALFFGTGLVATVDDFGSQGGLPSHPALLDWLATTFVQSGWDLKALHKRVVMSATYRQSSVVAAGGREEDPANRWLARGPSHRFTAEQIRDSALAVSGLLVRRVGGPSVYPYQPAGLWEELAIRNTTRYEQGHGEDLYRRSLYTVWKRSTPPPSAISFDAAERLSCSVRRQRTSTPLQSLILMNDPQYVEAARLLAERMIAEGGDAPAERVAYGFRLVTSRRPTEPERAVLVDLLEKEREHYATSPGDAIRLLSVGEHPRRKDLNPSDAAAYTVVANTLLSLDEAVTKR